jgi:protein phosphatase PTC7
VIRDNKFVFSTEEQQHWYDCPYQVGTNSTDTPLHDATSHVLKLLPSDIIVLASDGLSDNLWDQEILVAIAGLNEDATKQSVQDIADVLCKRARAVGEDEWGESPFMVCLVFPFNSRKRRLWKDSHFKVVN